jgi:hypothetical protein
MPKSLKDAIDSDIKSTKVKMIKYKNQVAKRKAESKVNFPGKNVFEIETLEDYIDMAALAGELKALNRIKRIVK